MYNKHAMSALMSTLAFALVASVSGYALYYACQKTGGNMCRVNPFTPADAVSALQGADMQVSVQGKSYVVIGYMVAMMVILFYIVFSTSQYVDNQ